MTDAMDECPRIHDSAEVEHGASIGARTAVWHRAHVRAGSIIGDDCSVGFSSYVDTGVIIGNRCKIQNHVSVYNGVIIEDEVLVGPAVTFTNDLYPRADNPDWQIVPTRIRTGAGIGANATIRCGVEVGEWAMIGAGSVVVHDVAANALVVGNPARQIGWVCSCGNGLGTVDAFDPVCGRCGTRWDISR